MPLGLSAAELALIGATFLASAVEIVEAYTIVLAMGLTRGWRSAGAGALAALVLLAVLTVVAGYTILRLIPPSLLQLVVGTLLLIFGMQWLRKAVLRSAGRKALHDEDAIYATEVEAAQAAPVRTLLGLDWFAFVVAFKGVLLEGLEVVVIVLTFGISAGNIPLAAVGALLAIVPVTILVIPRPQAPVAGPREQHQVRRRPAPDDVRHVLGDRGPRAVRDRQREPGMADRGPRDRGHPARLDRRIAPADRRPA